MLCALPVGECALMPARVPRRALDHLIVVVRNADEHADVGAFFEIEHHARVLDRLPRRLQQQPLLRIDVGRLARRNAEKLRIELVDAIDETAALGDGFAGQARLGIVKALHIPPVRRHVADRLPALDEQFPEGVRVIDSAGKPAADSDDGNAVLWTLRLMELARTARVMI